eukprot:scaffold522_cov168-Amphora_coffeaeformis.AAC.15
MRDSLTLYYETRGHVTGNGDWEAIEEEEKEEGKGGAWRTERHNIPVLVGVFGPSCLPTGGRWRIELLPRRGTQISIKRPHLPCGHGLAAINKKIRIS